MLSRRTMIGTIAALAALAAGPALAQQERMPVVATFSILGDLVKQVGGERIDLAVLVGPNGDAHVYSPSPTDAKKLAAAKVVFVNGLKFEGWIDRLVKASGTKAMVVAAAKSVKPIEAAEEEHVHDHGKGDDKSHDHDHGGFDPHAWQDIANAKLYVAAIRDGLAAADPAGRQVYEANAKAYLDRLDALDAEVRAALAAIPEAQRKIITAHDAFGYFTRAYGVQFIAPQGVSTEAEASAKDVGRIIRQIKAQKIKAVFLENISDPRLVERIAKETGARMGGRLYSDALSEPAGPAGTYIDMMRHNIRTLTAALTS
ncbi:metal ABC transporter substrate-binding protein [Chelatococcus sp. SYSU_G07232]|uniref:Metal ABC transporter substrate-binding protein n=1 Tax=Chelatococcus albus TaxID=3047466 RepID=A0ABT7AIC4_9HYPH|nr:metal ABC transporter substrate-binding protein [Chelatococcus sp. SYSU_G07232]MDJ1158351.1 metal ABC transporter substrate-binding protein [Chelatococcus sp. SYSU_G07232]